MNEKKYVLHPHIEVADGEDWLTAQLLANRGIPESDQADFLAPDYERHLHDPFLMTDMRIAVNRLLLARENDEKVVIYSDYDCDGIPAGTLMHDFFKKIGITNFTNYIPHRHFEGFGLNSDAVQKFIDEGVALVITLDCGTVSFEPIAKAKAAGIDVIVIDHHEPEKGRLPETIALLNPKRDEAYPFRELCATGVAFKFVQACVHELKARGEKIEPEGWEKWLLDLVGIATIADMVPLRGENRVLAQYGLKVLRKSRRIGLQKLFRKNKINPQYLAEDDIGFTIGPRINAASRMDTAEIGFRMLSATDEGEAGAAVDELEKLNASRKGVVAAMSRELAGRLADFDEIPSVIVIGNPEWRPSLVGLSANSLVERYNRPVFVWGRDGKGIIKGSCRSPHASIIAIMDHAKDAFLHYGGHHGAGGFEVSDANIHELAGALNDAYKKLSDDERSPSSDVLVDAVLSLDDVSDSCVSILRTLAPYGMKNPKPLFRFEKVIPLSVELFGKTQEHTKIMLRNKKGPLTAISFFKKPEQFSFLPEAGKSCTLIANIEESFFMGRPERRLRVVEIVA